MVHSSLEARPQNRDLSAMFHAVIRICRFGAESAKGAIPCDT